MTRTCNKCKIVKPIEDFSRDRNRAGGRAYTCKSCNSRRANLWSRANPEKRQEAQRKWRELHREQQRACSRAHYKKNRERIRERVNAKRADPEFKVKERWKWIKLNYNMTRQQWEGLFVNQGRCCASCKSIDPKHKLGWHTDHDHKTGKVRGIVCGPCNLIFGAAYDDPTILDAAAEYLRRSV